MRGAAIALALLLPGTATAECPDFNPLNNLYWGDLHVHTRYSLDASTQDTRTTPQQAYDFARGEAIGVQPWLDGQSTRTLQLTRPLDFAAVTDHAELIGEVELCTNPASEGYGSLWCRGFRTFPRLAFFLFNATASSGGRTGLCDDGRCEKAASAPWQEMREAAESAYDAGGGCRFTSLLAYEWTGASENVSNLHRNVIFRDERVPPLPISFLDAPSAPELHRALDRACAEAGCEALVIPHNSNLSDGYMFPVGINAEDAALRHRFERLVEIFQHKGSSECFGGAANTEDELCAFEQLPYDKFTGKFSKWNREPPEPGDGYAREVLARGLKERDRLGGNPFEFGMIGSTDTHLGTPGLVAESGYVGHGGAGKQGAEGLADDLEFNPGGLVAVWAPQNRREALYDALYRREAYATSGPRIELRLFAGESLPANLCKDPEFTAVGYGLGEPMGAVLESQQTIRLAVAARRDPRSLPLQRLQVIKGWRDPDGTLRERVLDVAGDPDNGAGVNLDSCETFGRGFDQLCTVWQDPDFTATQPAFYYARAVENPSCRWSQRACLANNVDCSNPGEVPDEFEACCSDSHRPVIQERAVSSPIWYYPEENESTRELAE